MYWCQSPFIVGDQVDPYNESFLMYTIDHAERALQQHNRNEKTLRCYSIAVLHELCVKHGIQVDVGSSRPLKKPYIDALLLTHVRLYSSLLVQY
jgi:hypothetical protein